MLDETAKGVFAIAATPFTDDGALDFDSIDRMVDFYVECGVSGLTILGIMGEAAKLSNEESAAVASRILARLDGKIPVVVGVSAPSMNAIQSLTKKVTDMGAAGVMVAPMSGLHTDQQIESYFHSVCESLGDTPIVLQDYPPTTGVWFSTPLLNKLFTDLPSLKVLKHEDWPGLRKLTQFRAAEAAGERRRVSVLVGNGGVFLPQELRRGADGAMTRASPIRKCWCRCVTSTQTGNPMKRKICSMPTCHLFGTNSRSASGWPYERKSFVGAG